jgi:hypothetical protein
MRCGVRPPYPRRIERYRPLGKGQAMTTNLDRSDLEEKRPQRGYSQADWESIVASLNELTLEAIGGCEVCGDLADYEGRACADRHVVKLCKRCLDIAINKLIRIRDDATLATGYEPLCNRCWRPIIDPRTHMDLRSLME